MTFPPLRFAPLLALALVALAACGGKSSTSVTIGKATPLPTQSAPATPVIKGGSVAAVVNGHRIPTSTYRLYVNFLQRSATGQPGMTASVIGQQAMNEVIINEIIREYAAAHHIAIDQTTLNKRIKTDEATNGGKKSLEGKLAQAGMTFSDYTTLLAYNMLGLKVIDQVAPLPKKAQPGPLQPVARVRHILIMFHPTGKPARTDAQAKARAEQILAELKHGGSFSTLARKYSEDPGSANKGGVYVVHPNEMVAPFDHASFTLPPHHPAIIKSQFGYHIIEVLSRGKAASPTLSPQQVQQQRFTAWIDAQMKHAQIRKIAQVAT